MAKKIKILIIDQPHSEVVKALREHILSSNIDAQVIVNPDFKIPLDNEEYVKESISDFWKMVEANKREVETWPLWKQNIVITAETASTGQFIKRKKRKK